jgi:hypothetical protein
MDVDPTQKLRARSRRCSNARWAGSAAPSAAASGRVSAKNTEAVSLCAATPAGVRMISLDRPSEGLGICSTSPRRASRRTVADTEVAGIAVHRETWPGVTGPKRRSIQCARQQMVDEPEVEQQRHLWFFVHALILR